MRGTAFWGGYHDLVIAKGGLNVFPRLVAARHHQAFRAEQVCSGVGERLDTLLGGGLDRGTSMLLIGPSGAGKSTLSLAYLTAALDRGERALIASFDEASHVLLQRAAGVGMDLSGHLERQPADRAGRSRQSVAG